ncbi:DgyrCDS14870 [Dimorphilus gyrociliatus]|uniref:DgyrCDS14870 n=1 Tax=Dimorphilus gyrociliatus TaxID=2664684 RepID=A0A7I8WF56_9ANNE|nr:DgyrCDS14870 [Dimorphilus gyrociliatus]
METNRWCIPIFEDPTQSIDITEKNLKVQISFLFHCYYNAYYSRFHVTFDSAICKQFFNYQLLGACCIKEALADPSDNVEELKLDLKNYRFLKDLMKTVKEEDAFKNILDFYEKKVLNINKKNLEIIGERSDKVFSNWKKKLLKFYNDCHAPTPTKETTATTTNPIPQSSATENELENETTTPAENTDIIVPAQPTASTARRFSEETTIIQHRQQSGIETVTPQLFESGEEYFQEQEMAISALQSELEPLTTEIESAQPTTGLESAPQSTGIEPAPPTTGLESELPSTNCENIEEMHMEIYNQMGLGENLEVGEMMQLDEDVQNDDAVTTPNANFLRVP